MRLWYGVVLWLAATTAQAQAQVVIYRCTDASGALTVQNDEPCPKGAKQERSIIDPPPAMPTYIPAPPPPAPITPITQSVRTPASAAPVVARPQAPRPADIADAQRLPPPPLYQCNTWDNDSYLHEDPAPKPRCVRIQTTGLGGDPGGGAGAACEMKYDQCQRVPDGAACAGWQQRQREIESAWRHARGDDKPPLQEEFARVARILSDSTCGK